MAFQPNETQEMPPSSDKHLCNGGSWSGFATRSFGGFFNVKSKSSTGNHASEIQVIYCPFKVHPLKSFPGNILHFQFSFIGTILSFLG